MDYSEARLLDPDWWKRNYILLTGMVREDDLAVQRGVFDFHRALVANAGLTEDSFKSAQTNARDTFYDMIGMLRPWEGTTAKERKAKETEDMRAAWFQAFGIDPDDPDWEAREEQKVEAWREERERLKAEAPEDDYNRVMRLRGQREQRVTRLRRQISRHKAWQGS